MVKKAMTIEKGIVIEVATEHLFLIKSKLRKLKYSKEYIDSNILNGIRDLNIEIIDTINSLSSKTVNEIYETKSEFDNKYGYFQKLLSV
ncbi:hypothetical protein [Moraxella lincolnii]|uniref:Uncharacterized protein n=1 Tax=Lwoffella lincolnii TaxID=90241 RepID=A0A1T0CK99_9GAMM|nr:hypothetical protein [Moraxella lincolnii]OOS22767.1 hypothetical protein B0682_00665 [Moraxella lincolnii]